MEGRGRESERGVEEGRGKGRKINGKEYITGVNGEQRKTGCHSDF